jgi:hypothetical protein
MLHIVIAILGLMAVAMASASPSKSQAVSSLRAAAAASNCSLDNSPWILSNLTLFTSSDNSTNSLSFHFTDPNPGLHLDTNCFAGNTSGGGNCNEDNYCACDNNDVLFQYTKDGSISIQRTAVDNW